MSYLHTILFLICLPTTPTFTHLIPVTWASLLYRTRPTDIPTPGPGPRFPWGPHGSPFVVFWPLLSVICSRRLSCFPSPTKSLPPCLLSFFYNLTPADSVLCVCPPLEQVSRWQGFSPLQPLLLSVPWVVSAWHFTDIDIWMNESSQRVSEVQKVQNLY